MSSDSLAQDVEARLTAELDAWLSLGKVAQFWWRDDDAVMETPQLRRLLDVARELQIQPALAVIPARVNSSLVEALRGIDCCIWQHGYSHDFHVAGEFGEGRLLNELQRDAVRGQVMLDRAFGAGGWQRVFVPPNHMLALPFKGLIPGLGYVGLSAGAPATPVLPHVFEANAELDVMDWPARRLLPADELGRWIVALLQARRFDPNPQPIGILTHHLVFDEEAWACICAIVKALHTHAAAEFVAADALFPKSGRGEISVVLTSCGRPDLLRRTLESFLLHCDAPIHEILVIEDGEAPSQLAQEEQFGAPRFRWLCTGQRRGQVQAVDLAYGLVRSPYIFHCEDDWQFYGSSFLKKSLTILEHNPDILQVWLRAVDDTNGHPIEGEELFADGVPYRRMAQNFQTEEWGTWHGFSWNPGLRRRRDYLLLGSFGALQRPGQKAWEVERAASEFFSAHGLTAAILTDDDGRGHVKHIGWGRRVGDPERAANEGLLP